MATLVEKHIEATKPPLEGPVADVDDFNKDAALARKAIAEKIASDAEKAYFKEHGGGRFVWFYRWVLALLEVPLEYFFVLAMTSKKALAAFVSGFLPLIFTILARDTLIDRTLHVSPDLYFAASFVFIFVFGFVFFVLFVSSVCTNDCGIFSFVESSKSSVSNLVFLRVSRADSDATIDAVMPLADLGKTLSRMFFVHRKLQDRVDGYAVWEISIDDSLLDGKKDFGVKSLFSDNLLAKNEDQVLEFEGRFFNKLSSGCYAEARLAWLNKVPFIHAEDVVTRMKSLRQESGQSVSWLRIILANCLSVFTTKSFLAVDRVVGAKKSFLGFIVRFFPVLFFCLYVEVAILVWCAISFVAIMFMALSDTAGKRLMHGEYYRD